MQDASILYKVAHSLLEDQYNLSNTKTRDNNQLETLKNLVSVNILQRRLFVDTRP